MSELKPCPLCGGEVTAIETHPGYGEVCCGECDLVLGGNSAMTPEELTRRWNKRRVPPGSIMADIVAPATPDPALAREYERGRIHERFAQQILREAVGNE